MRLNPLPTDDVRRNALLAEARRYLDCIAPMRKNSERLCHELNYGFGMFLHAACGQDSLLR